MSPSESELTTTPKLDEVLTLAEAASYLRVSEEELHRLASEGGVPARKIGEEWRFLKAALYDWLRHGPHLPREWFRLGPPWLFDYPPLEVLFAEFEHRLLAKIPPLEQPSGQRGSKQRVLDLSGRWKEDRSADDLLAEVYKRRGRPIDCH